MFPIFLIGVVTGVVLATVVFHFVKSAPSNTKFKIQDEQLKAAQEDLRMLEEELTKSKAQIEKLRAKIKKEKEKTTK